VLKRSTLLATLALAAMLAAPAAQAEWPDRPIHFIVGFGPGGANDLIGRIAADGAGKELKQTVVVENRPGAGAVIGTAYVAHAQPDLARSAPALQQLPFGVELEHRRRGIRALRLRNRLRHVQHPDVVVAVDRDRRDLAEHPIVGNRGPGWIDFELGRVLRGLGVRVAAHAHREGQQRADIRPTAERRRFHGRA